MSLEGSNKLNIWWNYEIICRWPKGSVLEVIDIVGDVPVEAIGLHLPAEHQISV
jgi:hypothetical protein